MGKLTKPDAKILHTIIRLWRNGGLRGAPPTLVQSTLEGSERQTLAERVAGKGLWELMAKFSRETRAKDRGSHGGVLDESWSTGFGFRDTKEADNPGKDLSRGW